MAAFNFYLDEKVTTWYRTNFGIVADTLEEAKEKAKEFAKTEEVDEIEWNQVEDTIVKMELVDNGGFSTAEIYQEETNDLIFQNGKEF